MDNALKKALPSWVASLTFIILSACSYVEEVDSPQPSEPA